MMVCIILLVPMVLLAQSPPGSGAAEGIKNPLQFKSLSDFVAALVTIARDIGMLVAVLGIVYAGFLKVTARGDEEKLKKANKAFLWAVMGTAVLLGAWLIAFSIQNTVEELETKSSSLDNIYTQRIWTG